MRNILRNHHSSRSTSLSAKRILVFVGITAGLLLQNSPAMAQQAFSLIGTRRSQTNSLTDPVSKKIYFINPATDEEYRTIDMSSFNLNGNNYIGLNGLAYQQSNNSLYFTTILDPTTAAGARPGTGGLYSYNLTTNTVATVLTTLGNDPQGNLIGSDNAATYNGFYYFVQDQIQDSTPNLYRVNLSNPSSGVQVLEDFNGTTATGSNRDYYDFGDIAISSAGELYGSANSRTPGATTGATTVFFSSSIAGSTSSTMSSVGYSETTGVATTYQLAFGWQTPTALNNTLYGQASGGAAGTGTGTVYTVNPSNGSTLTTITTSGLYSDLTSAPLAPTPAPPGVVSGLIGIAMGGAQFGMTRVRRRRRAAKDAPKSTVTVSE